MEFHLAKSPMNSVKNSSSSSNELATVLAWLKENFSIAFPHHARDVQPLSLGIMEDIMEFYNRMDTPPFSKKKLRAAIGYYTMSPGYLKAQQSGRARIDLYGNEVEVVTEEQSAYAQKKFEQRYLKKSS